MSTLHENSAHTLVFQSLLRIAHSIVVDGACQEIAVLIEQCYAEHSCATGMTATIRPEYGSCSGYAIIFCINTCTLRDILTVSIELRRF